MRAAMPRDRIALLLATLVTAAAVYAIPSWRGALRSPCHLASIGACVTLAVLHVARGLGPRGVRIERHTLAAFLIGMPVVYIASWLVTPGAERSWLWIEAVGLPIYAALAVLGLRRSPWFLAAGIVGHGVFWDAWHMSSEYVPLWYAVSCLLVDLALGLYVATRIPAGRVPLHAERS
jgi:hypothetical protein